MKPIFIILTFFLPELNRGPAQSYPRLKFLMPVLEALLTSTYNGALTPLFAATANEVETKNIRCAY